MGYRLLATLTVTAKRLLSQPGLALAGVLGLAMTIALAMSIPIYADAVYYRAFVEKLAGSVENPRPPFSFTFSFTGGGQPVTWEGVRHVDSFVSDQTREFLGMRQDFAVRHFKTGTYPVFPFDETDFSRSDRVAARLRFGVLSGIEQRITFTEGAWAAESGDLLNVMVTHKAAADLDLQVGERFKIVLTQRLPDGRLQYVEFPVRISGLWQPKDPTEPFWFVQPAVLIDYALISEVDFAARVAPHLPAGAVAADWFLVMDGANVDYNAASALLRNIEKLETHLGIHYPGTRLVASPRSELETYVRDADILTIQLYAFGIPIIGLLLAFVGLSAALAMERRRNEIAVLRSRGATLLQMTLTALQEAVLLAAAALVIAAPLGLLFAGLIGQSRGFLEFTGDAGLRLRITPSALVFAAGVIVLALAAQVIPTLNAARHTVTSYKRSRARVTLAPWWQRAWLDVLLFIPAAYGAYLLAQQGQIAVIGTDAELSRNPFENPLLFLVPALGIFALTLFCLRLIPIFMTIFAWLTAQTRSVALLITVRQMARLRGFYTMPLILLVLTLSLSVFTATLAGTLNKHLRDEAYYNLGADAKFFDFGVEIAGMQNLADRFSFLPVANYAQAPFVHGVARVGQYDSLGTFAGRTYRGRFLGVDRYEFSSVSFWRADFADDSLGALMNALALSPDAVLVPRDFLNQTGLLIGDQIRITVESATSKVRLDLPLTIVGHFDYFPTWYPAEGVLFVGNLDYVFQQAGGDFPYHVWFRAEPHFRRIHLAIPDSQPVAMHAADYLITKAESRPERQGVFGLLSVGFLGAAVMTVVGFLLYVLFSFRQRYIEMGILRAIGLSSQQLTVLLVSELAFVIFTGGLIGTALGILVSGFTIPYLQVGDSVPPFAVEIAWPAVFRVYVLFGWLFVMALALLVISLRRMRIFQAIKMGETV